MPDAKLISRIAARRKPRWVAPEKGHSANDKVRSSQERETASRRSLFGLEEIHQGAINNAEERSERNAETTRAEVIKTLCKYAGIDPNELPTHEKLKAVALLKTPTRGSSNKDKRRHVEAALRINPTRSNREIARETGTTHPFVARMRQKMETVTTGA
jgi:hypothetical protein